LSSSPWRSRSPVAPKELAEALVARVLGAGLPAAVAAPPASVRWRAPVTGPRHRVGHDARLLVTRRGVLDRTTDVVPLAKAQSLRTTQGPWQRRLGLASVHVDSAGRRLPGAVAQHRGAAEAERLVEELTTLARTARAS
jgi:putative membrane protein